MRAGIGFQDKKVFGYVMMILMLALYFTVFFDGMFYLFDLSSKEQCPDPAKRTDIFFKIISTAYLTAIQIQDFMLPHQRVIRPRVEPFIHVAAAKQAGALTAMNVPSITS